MSPARSATPRSRARSREDAEILHFAPDGAAAEIEERLAQADVILVSIAPGTSIDPVLARYGRRIAGIRRAQKILYLSTIGVYGDRGGEWVDETALPHSDHERSKVRISAERAWLGLARDPAKTVHILRLSGIYGPGRRNALLNLRAGKARRLVKPGQVFNRIHAEDIARACAALVAYEGASDVWNVTDDEPAPPQDVIAFAAEMMGVAPPPEQDFATAELTPMARSFYGENKRCANRKIKEEAGLELAYPTYREGIAALWADGEGPDARERRLGRGELEARSRSRPSSPRRAGGGGPSEGWWRGQPPLRSPSLFDRATPGPQRSKLRLPPPPRFARSPSPAARRRIHAAPHCMVGWPRHPLHPRLDHRPRRRRARPARRTPPRRARTSPAIDGLRGDRGALGHGLPHAARVAAGRLHRRRRVLRHLRLRRHAVDDGPAFLDRRRHGRVLLRAAAAGASRRR